MKIEQEFIAEFFRVLRGGQRVGEVVGKIVADWLHENAQADPVETMSAEHDQAGHVIRAVLENFSVILGLFQERQVRAKCKIGGVRGGSDGGDEQEQGGEFFEQVHLAFRPVILKQCGFHGPWCQNTGFWHSTVLAMPYDALICKPAFPPARHSPA